MLDDFEPSPRRSTVSAPLQSAFAAPSALGPGPSFFSLFGQQDPDQNSSNFAEVQFPDRRSLPQAIASLTIPANTPPGW
jgi:hypothetical protein